MGKLINSTPFVIEKKQDGDRAYDIYSRLLEDRIIILGSEVTDDIANSIVAQLLLLDERDSTRDISLYINSPGGSITAGLAIYDTMQYVRSNIRTVCIGSACSMAAILLSSGTKGKRVSLPNSYIMIHQPRQNIGHTMTVTEQEIDLKLTKGMKRQLTSILAKNCNQPYKKIFKDCEKDKWFTSQEALQYGIIDDVIIKKPS